MLTKDSLKIPKNWEIIAGADTGTYMGGAICAIDPNYELYVLEEFPNYHYTGDGTIELTGMTVSEWIKRFAMSLRKWTGERRTHAWVDANTTFKTEVGYGFKFKMNKKDLELRTEITREYLRNGRLHFMPWLTIIPREMELAEWPDQESASGRYKRIKRKDHCLDGVEHVCSRRPHPDMEIAEERKQSPLKNMIQKYTNQQGRHVDPVMGAL